MSSAPTTTLEIRRVSLETLSLDPANARAHGDRNLEAIAASLQRFGQAEPLVVLKSSGRVIGGNGRLVAMRKLGWSECDVVELDLDDTQAAALGIALNRTGELAEWDQPALARILEELQAQGELDGVGFEDAEVDRLLDELIQEAPEDLEDTGPEEPPEAPVSRPGDLWVLGDHRLLCGDSTDPDVIERVLAGEKASLMATDPPYCIDYTGKDRPEGSGKDWSQVYRETEIADLGTFLDGFLSACLTRLVDDAGIYLWHASSKYPVVAGAFEKHGLLLHQVLIWAKPTPVFGHSFYAWRHEPCAYGWKQGHQPRHRTQKADSVWELDWEGKQRVVGNEHPTQKPLRVFEIPMEQHTRPGDVVLEPFSGSGSQLIAAERLGRMCRAVELEPAFVDVAVRRWQKATSKVACLESGQSYAEARGDRES